MPSLWKHLLSQRGGRGRLPGEQGTVKCPQLLALPQVWDLMSVDRVYFPRVSSCGLTGLYRWL